MHSIDPVKDDMKLASRSIIKNDFLTHFGNIQFLDWKNTMFSEDEYTDGFIYTFWMNSHIWFVLSTFIPTAQKRFITLVSDVRIVIHKGESFYLTLERAIQDHEVKYITKITHIDTGSENHYKLHLKTKTDSKDIIISEFQ